MVICPPYKSGDRFQKPNDVSRIVEQHLKGKKIVKEKLHPRIHLNISY